MKNTQIKQVLFVTAMVNVLSQSGVTYTFRALLDRVSQATFITESAVQLLGLKKICTSVLVTGLCKFKAPAPSLQ